MKSLFIAAAFVATAANAVDVTPVGFASTEDNKTLLILQDARGHCPAQTYRFYIVHKPSGQIWTGCWTLSKDRVAGLDEEGHSIDLPADAFEWTRQPKQARAM